MEMVVVEPQKAEESPSVVGVAHARVESLSVVRARGGGERREDLAVVASVVQHKIDVLPVPPAPAPAASTSPSPSRLCLLAPASRAEVVNQAHVDGIGVALPRSHVVKIQR